MKICMPVYNTALNLLSTATVVTGNNIMHYNRCSFMPHRCRRTRADGRERMAHLSRTRDTLAPLTRDDSMLRTAAPLVIAYVLGERTRAGRRSCTTL